MNTTDATEAKQGKEAFDQYAIVELMGHVRLAGRVTEAPLFGVNLGRIDIPTKAGGFVTQYFGGASIYRLTPITEEVARAVALHNEPEPVYRWELPSPGGRGDDDDREDADDDREVPY